jgi:hypothetical protein
MMRHSFYLSMKAIQESRYEGDLIRDNHRDSDKPPRITDRANGEHGVIGARLCS